MVRGTVQQLHVYAQETQLRLEGCALFGNANRRRRTTLSA